MKAKLTQNKLDQQEAMFLKSTLKAILYRLGYAAHLHTRLLNRVKQHKLVSILSLHRVSNEKNPFWPPLTPKTFDGLLTYLKKHFTLCTLHELENFNAKKPPLVLSFDDGYYDFIEYAMPVLHKHGIKANQNIIPSQLLNEAPLWNIALYDFLNAAPMTLLKELRFLDFNVKTLLQKKINKTGIGLLASKCLKPLTFNERNSIIDQLEKTLFTKLEPYPKTRMIRLTEMAEVIREHEVGVHSYSHNSMANETQAYFIEDFLKCREFFKTHQFPNLDIYAFPNGSYRQEQLDYLKENGINHILLVNDEYADMSSPYNRFNIAAFNRYEAIFQALGIKSNWKKRNPVHG